MLKVSTTNAHHVQKAYRGTNVDSHARDLQIGADRMHDVPNRQEAMVGTHSAGTWHTQMANRARLEKCSIWLKGRVDCQQPEHDPVAFPQFFLGRHMECHNEKGQEWTGAMSVIWRASCNSACSAWPALAVQHCENCFQAAYLREVI